MLLPDAIYSSYCFHDSFLSLKGRVSLPIFAKYVVVNGALAPKERLQDLLVWWEHRHSDDVLFFCSLMI